VLLRGSATSVVLNEVSAWPWPAAAGRRGGAAGLDQTQHQRRQVGCDRVLEADDFDIGRIGHVHHGDDPADALQVVGVVGDDQ